MTLDEVDSTVATDIGTVAVVSPPVVVSPPPVVVSPVVITADVVPVVETPVVMAVETPDMMGMVIEIPVAVVAVTAGVVVPPIVVVVGVVVVVVGTANPLVCEAPVAAPASTPAEPLLGLKLWALFGNCQANNSRGLKLRAKMRFLVFNMMII
ncbi:hypothetical protein FJR39_20610 [Dolichospermum flos-aquae UHCC 0037]|uniref:Uncharacterized protein n=1 Tax=Dolichospermum flos-aquae UHCC 0037 TaxID=2590026 RepID=A0ACC7SAK9_DOLFA|nr:hypothetical protein [Dolichospermum flos-aquae UHCC 0037]